MWFSALLGSDFSPFLSTHAHPPFKNRRTTTNSYPNNLVPNNNHNHFNQFIASQESNTNDNMTTVRLLLRLLEIDCLSLTLL